MAAKKNKKKADDNTIAVNRKVRHDFFIEERFEAAPEDICAEKKAGGI